MVSSPSSSPLSDTPPTRGSQGQLLQELEALSQALYQAQQHRPSQQRHSQPPPPPTRKNLVSSFLSRRASSHAAHPKGSGGNQPIPLPGLANRGPKPPPFSLISRHSLEAPQPPLVERAEEPAVKQRFSTSAAAPQPSGFVDPGEKADIRSRHNRRTTLQAWQSQPAVLEEEEELWTDDHAEFSRKLETPLEKKKSIWNWKPLRALTHIGRHRFLCLFSAHVHTIEGIPAAMNGLRLVVHLRKKETKEGAVQTMPSRIFQGITEFDETLYLKCSVYGTKSPPHGMKFMAREFILSVIAPDVDELDLGKHQLDLSRLLVEPVDERRGAIEKRTSWSTSFVLSGKAKGAKVVVTFEYEILDKDSPIPGNASSRPTGSPTHRTMRTSYSLPNSAHGTPRGLTGRGAVATSPSVSEPGNDMDDLLSLDQLSLDEPSPVAHSSETSKGVTTKVQGFPTLRSQVERPYSAGNQVFNPLPNLGRTSPHGDSGYQVESRNSNTSFEPKLTNLPRSEPDLEQKPRVGDPGLAPSTPRLSLDSSDFTRETGFIRQTSEEAGSSDEETEFDVVEQGVEREELHEASAIETDAGEVVQPEGGETGLREVNASSPVEEAVSTRQDSRNAPHEQVNIGLSRDEHIVDSSRIQAVTLPESGEPNSSQTQRTNPAQSEVKRTHNEVKKDVGPVNAVKESVTTQMILRTLETLLQGTAAIERSHMDTSQDKLGSECKTEMDTSESVVKREVESIGKGRDENLDNEANVVAGEFLHMLEVGNNTLGSSSDSESDSPRARLLKQFEKEALLEGGLGIELDLPEVPAFKLDDGPVETAMGTPNDVPQKAAPFIQEHNAVWDSDDDKELASIVVVAETELNRATQSIRSKTRAKLLEDAETEALMQEWGLNEKAFAKSPSKQGCGAEASNSIGLYDPPPLAQELGPAVTVKDGGSLRAMSPAHFQSSKNDGKLVMQVSKPVVVPTEMGSGAVDVLRNMAAMGMESMAAQAMAVMPLEDVAGQTLEQIAIEGMAAGKALRNEYAALTSRDNDRGMSKRSLATKPNASKFGARSIERTNDEFVSLEDLAPMAMHQIEALAVEGLKIQADMTDDDAPFALNALSLADTGSADSRNGENENRLGILKGVAGVPLHQAGETPGGGEIASGASGPMAMAISLDEWMRLDAGLDDGSETDKKTSAIMAAHHAVHRDHDKRSRKDASLGCMGNTITIAVLVQLRDPVRNYEAVGSPMMALVQAERVVLQPKPKLGRMVSMKGSSEEEVEEADTLQFKITGVHVAGLKAPENEKKKGWGSQGQQQSGSRWLVAHGMTKNANNHPLLKSKPNPVSTSAKTKTLQGESLWSISARSYGSGSKWKEMGKLNSHVRNPDVIFANRSIRRK